MTTEEVISAVGLIGFGGVLTALASSVLRNRERKFEANHKFKETRYKAVVLLMFCYLEYNKGINVLIQRPDIQSKENLFNELKAEWINMTIYASPKVILSVKSFLINPSLENFNRASLEFRGDLYGGLKWKLSLSDLQLPEIAGY